MGRFDELVTVTGMWIFRSIDHAPRLVDLRNDVVTRDCLFDQSVLQPSPL